MLTESGIADLTAVAAAALSFFAVVVPLLSVFLANARQLPAGRVQAGDRHLNFHDYRDVAGLFG